MLLAKGGFAGGGFAAGGGMAAMGGMAAGGSMAEVSYGCLCSLFKKKN
jgi:hypothetical protein